MLKKPFFYRFCSPNVFICDRGGAPFLPSSFFTFLFSRQLALTLLFVFCFSAFFRRIRSTIQQELWLYLKQSLSFFSILISNGKSRSSLNVSSSLLFTSRRCFSLWTSFSQHFSVNWIIESLRTVAFLGLKKENTKTIERERAREREMFSFCRCSVVHTLIVNKISSSSLLKTVCPSICISIASRCCCGKPLNGKEVEREGVNPKTLTQWYRWVYCATIIVRVALEGEGERWGHYWTFLSIAEFVLEPIEFWVI